MAAVMVRAGGGMVPGTQRDPRSGFSTCLFLVMMIFGSGPMALPEARVGSAGLPGQVRGHFTLCE